MDTPILFIIFNRPDTTQRLFDAIRQVKPKRLFVAADGPRTNKVGEAQLCQQTRAIIEQVDWECEVKTLFQQQNLGCSRNLSMAITWFFENVEEGIILEDDTLPHASFFPYCEELLKKYSTDTRIMMISGYNALQTWNTEYDYLYTMTASAIWGWATWRRAWQLYDYNMNQWQIPDARRTVHAVSTTDFAWKRRRKLYTKILHGGGDAGGSWDFQWAFCRFINSGLTITPAKNLIQNLGFDKRATNTGVQFHSLPTLQEGLTIPLRHNPIVSYDREYERAVARHTELRWHRKLHTFLRVDFNTKKRMLRRFMKRHF